MGIQDLKTKWLYDNYAQLRVYEGQYIAHDEKGIISHDESLSVVLKKARLTGKDFYVYFVPKNFDLAQINMLKILPVSKNLWKPTYPVTLQIGQHEPITTEMLIDSGADISVISYDTGISLGLKETEGEVFEHAAGIGGVIAYAMRRIQFTIDNVQFEAPVAWVQNQYTKDVILGREVVFDIFDVEFKQKDRQIIFKRRADT